MSALENIKVCLATRRHFVLQGGAGSGKTETLKELLAFIAQGTPTKALTCITHTNKAAEEISRRTGAAFPVSTIHAFLHSLIAGFKIDIHRVIIEIFKVHHFNGEERELFDDDKAYFKAEFELYKKTYEKFSQRSYDLNKTKVPKHPGKIQYDKDRDTHNKDLNKNISELNVALAAHLDAVDPHTIKYNHKKYDSLRHATYGHDGLIAIAAILLDRSAVLRKIVADRFQYLFIDEYQDTSPKIIDVLLTKMKNEKDFVIGLFGDSMQGIYEDGVGDVDIYVADGSLVKIEKEDNFRCSEQVINFLNLLRLDGMKQAIAFKPTPDGKLETKADRQGHVRCYYAIYENKPNAFSDRTEKDKYSSALQKLIVAAGGVENQKMLVLTNRAIAVDAGFSGLFGIFYERYSIELGEQIERALAVLQFADLAEMCVLFAEKRYNEILSRLRASGFYIANSTDKSNLFNRLTEISESKLSALHVLDLAFSGGILRKSEDHFDFLEYSKEFLADLESDKQFLFFKADFKGGIDTLTKMIKAGRDIDEFSFTEMERKLKKATFLIRLLSDELRFDEILNYYDYLAEKKNFLTMHKTKGTGIRNVLVVLEEYYWNKYDFKNIFSIQVGLTISEAKNRKLIYVACSRAEKNLTCVRLIDAGEEASIIKSFANIVKVPIEQLT